MSEHDTTRRRLSTRQVAALFALLVAAVTGVVLWLTLGRPDAEPVTATPPASETSAPVADDGAAIAKARSNLQAASLPLSVLSGGVGQLVDGGRQLDDGANQLSDGLGQARDGARQLSDGLTELSGGVGQLGDGARQVSGGVDEVVDRLAGLGDQQAQATAALRQVAATLSTSADPASQAAAARVTDLVAQLDAQGLGPDTLAQLDLLKNGARQLSYELNDPSAQFVSGVGQIADGAGQLSDGLVLLDDGGRALADGTGQLVDGAAPIGGVVKGLSTNVADASKALPPATSAARSGDVAEPQADAGEAGESAASGIPGWVYVGAVLAVLLATGLAWGAFVLGRRSAATS
ncbi:hypothetical protein EGT67_02580 [Prescottella agglutinans]|uniref:Uncharacterized protein n=1 Tax=Prescottella agglutinans TaxID=1644129 RepID=A0A3S3EDC8_9NOCA|nr:hypothetical protein [Prescottella agglutinans]RVW11327.1 hypothetical protein EGT67_02580 [Prescottella agglutinans]